MHASEPKRQVVQRANAQHGYVFAARATVAELRLHLEDGSLADSERVKFLEELMQEKCALRDAEGNDEVPKWAWRDACTLLLSIRNEKARNRLFHGFYPALVEGAFETIPAAFREFAHEASVLARGQMAQTACQEAPWGHEPSPAESKSGRHPGGRKRAHVQDSFAKTITTIDLGGRGEGSASIVGCTAEHIVALTGDSFQTLSIGPTGVIALAMPPAQSTVPPSYADSL